jgi:hypothetical protein
MADDQINVQVTADTSQFEAALQRACTAADANLKMLLQSAQTTNAGLGSVGPTAKDSMDKGAKATDEWTKSFTKLQNTFNSSIAGMILGTTTWQKAAQRITQQFLTDQINASLKWLESWIAKETGMTSATQTQAAARAEAEDSSQGSLLVLIGQTLARWLGLETEKTATTEGASLTRKLIAVSEGFGQIQIDAAVAAAGAMAAISAIPFVGPAMAPEVAMATYATTMGFATGLGAGLFSSAGGLWNVPADTLAMVHKQETILPASIAQPMRDFFTGGSGGGGDSYAITVQAIDARSGAQFLMDNAGVIAKSLAREMRNGNSILRSAR